jgi:hypothetical protein
MEKHFQTHWLPFNSGRIQLAFRGLFATKNLACKYVLHDQHTHVLFNSGSATLTLGWGQGQIVGELVVDCRQGFMLKQPACLRYQKNI